MAAGAEWDHECLTHSRCLTSAGPGSWFSVPQPLMSPGPCWSLRISARALMKTCLLPPTSSPPPGFRWGTKEVTQLGLGWGKEETEVGRRRDRVGRARDSDCAQWEQSRLQRTPKGRPAASVAPAQGPPPVSRRASRGPCAQPCLEEEALRRSPGPMFPP